MQPKISGTWRFSLIMTSTRGKTEVFDTLDDMPAVLRAECVRTLQSKDASTILISDAAGRRYLRQTMSEQYTEVEPALKRVAGERTALTAELLACGALGLAMWLVYTCL